MDTHKSTSSTPGAHALGLSLGCAVVDFWHNAGPDQWFAANADFDHEFSQRFMALHFNAARRECEHWLTDPKAALGLVLLLDQFPRNAFRGTAHMYATDPLAIDYAHRLLSSGCIDQLDSPLRLFACLPFMHSERLDDQERSLVLHRQHALGSMVWANEHHDIIRRFGRFPHRNPALARSTTAEEQAYLDGGGFAG